MELVHVNPDSLLTNPAFAQGVLVRNAGAMLYIGGQNGIDARGALVGDDISSQTKQAFSNLLEVLKSVDAGPEHVAKLNIFVVQGHDLRAAFAASQEVWGRHSTAVTVLVVAGLAVPGAVVEVDAVCALEGHSNQ